jgi:hypothetical protein
LFSFLLAQPVERFNHRAVKTADLEVSPATIRTARFRSQP